MRTEKKIGLLAIALLSVVVIASGAFASRAYFAPPEAAKIAPFVLESLSSSSEIPVIVKMKAQADLSGIENSRMPRTERLKTVYAALSKVAMDGQVEIVKMLDASGVQYRRFYITNMIAVFGANEALIKALAARNDVAKIYGNPTVKLNRPSEMALFMAALQSDRPLDDTVVGDNITYSNADKVWAKYGKAGEGIVVAGQDTGVEFDHPALLKQYRGNESDKISHAYSWHDSIHKTTPANTDGNRCGYDLEAPCDDGDHGSHTMGSIIGSDGDKNVIGMAPNAKWIACRNMDGGAGTPATYIECFEWLLAPYPYGGNPMVDGDPTKAAHIINNSWGCPESEGCSADEIAPSLAAMKAAGILVVVSAGNEGPGCGTIQDPPAWHSALTLSVGAYDHRRGTIADFSSRGPSKIDGEIGPDVVAPGVAIRSSVPGKKYAGGFMWSGTSMAGPHVAGAAALLWSVRPELIGDITKTTEILKATATAKTSTESCGGVAGTSIPNNTFGMGFIDIMKAISIAAGDTMPPTPPAPPSKTPTSTWPTVRKPTRH